MTSLDQLIEATKPRENSRFSNTFKLALSNYTVICDGSMMVNTQYAVAYDDNGDMYYLEDPDNAKLVGWFPVNNLYATIDTAWWGIYNAIERAMNGGMNLYSDRANLCDTVTDQDDPLFCIGNYKFIPVTLAMNYAESVGANDHLQEYFG